MLKKLFSSILVSIFIISCSNPPNSSDITETKSILEQYKKFEKLSENLVKSEQHGAIFVNTFMDAKSIDAFRKKNYPLPDGSLIVKEGHSTETSGILRIYIMKKVNGFDSSNGDWYYSMLDPKGEPLMPGGKISLCINCHQGAKDKDYVFGFEK